MSGSDNEQIQYGRGWKTYYTEVPNELFEENCSLKPHTFAVYVYLLKCLNVKKNGYTAWPSYTTMAKATRMSRQGAINAINELEGKEYIEREPRRISIKAYTSNLYYINHPTESLDWLSTSRIE